MEAINDADVRRAERNLGAARESETALGTLHSGGARRAWALANAYEARGMEAALASKFKADSDDEKAMFLQQAHRCAGMEKFLRELFWTQAKEDIGGDAWCKDGGIGLRSRWMVVALPSSPIEGVLSKLLGGAL